MFYGRISETPKLSNDNGADVVRFVLSADRFRKSKNGAKLKERNYLTFEAWDSAALTIAKNCNKGDFLLIPNSTARCANGHVIFRVNEFKLVSQAQEEEDNSVE